MLMGEWNVSYYYGFKCRSAKFQSLIGVERIGKKGVSKPHSPTLIQMYGFCWILQQKFSGSYQILFKYCFTLMSHVKVG